jgi:purine-binding chemotaxis protein CheW
MTKVVSFQVEFKKFVLPVNEVRSVFLALDITPVPGQSDNLLGVVEIEEEIVPVINLRHVIGLPNREIELQDQIIIAESKFGPIAMMADNVHGVIQYEANQVAAIDARSSSYAQGLLKIEGEFHLILDPSKLVPEEEVLLRRRPPAGEMT